MQDIKEKIASRLREAREAAGYSQIDVYRFTGISNKTLSGYELQRSTPDVNSIQLLADLYGVPPQWLYGLTDERPSAQSPLTRRRLQEVKRTTEELRQKVRHLTGLLDNLDGEGNRKKGPP